MSSNFAAPPLQFTISYLPDTTRPRYSKEVDDVVYEVDAQMIVVAEGDVDIGGNPSAEEQQEALENGAEQKINVVHTFNLQGTQFDKKSYMVHLKVSYMRRLQSRELQA